MFYNKLFNHLPFYIKEYSFTKLIAKGGFATIFLVENSKYSGQFCAKVIPLLDDNGENQKDTVENEINTLKTLNHPHIIRLYDSFFHERLFFIILEYCSGGNLLKQIIEFNGFSREKFIEIGRQIILALCFCHSQNIAHHDIKPENILLDSYNRIKLADFGISLFLDSYILSDSFAGSITYEAPEIISKKPYNAFKADIWSLGIVFLYMINGFDPWRCETIGTLKSRILSANYYIKNNCSNDIKDLIKSMVQINPDERITISQLENHPLFFNFTIPETFSDPDLIPDILSPHGRSHIKESEKRVKKRTSSESYKSNALKIFQYNFANGKKIPRFKSRFHITNSELSETFSSQEK